MKNNVALKLAASTLVLGVTMVGCKPAGYRPAAASTKAVKAEEGAAKAYKQAQAAFQQGNLAGAVTLAERAVELSPRDTGYRMLLADLYLKNGRFLSAENAFSDVLTLNPTNSRAGLSHALALIGQGKTGEASAALDGLVATAAPADVGLAFALAGQPQRALELLEPAARAPGANGRVRQNLALAYAIAGDWQKARTVAAQDLSPNEVAGRLEGWAALANPSATHLRVATLLGVTPVADSGQPVRLALTPAAPEPQAYAEVQAPAPAPAPAPMVEAPVQLAAVAAAPVEVPAEATTEAFAYQPPAQADLFESPAQVAVVEVPASAIASERTELLVGTQVAAAVQSLVDAPAPVIRASAPVASAPIPTFVPAKKPRVASSKPSRFVVQIGAFRTPSQVEKAWAQAYRRYGISDYEPLSTTFAVAGRGTFHRLAVAGFQTHEEAQRTCGTIRAKGGVCFVRATAGDAPVRWASRYTGRRA